MDASKLALGGAGESRWDLQDGLPTNPALLAGLDGVTFSTVLQFRQARRDSGVGTWKENRQDFPAFQFTLAFPAGWRLGLGYRARLRNRGSYSLSERMIDLPEGESDWDGRYELDLVQEGGLSSFPISLAWQASPRLRLGLALSLLRANLFQEWSYRFPEGSGLYDRKVKRQADWHGSAVDFGAQARLGSNWGLSLLYRGGSDLSGLNRIEIAGQAGAADSSLAGSYPASWSAGLTWASGRRIMLSAAWNHLAWSRYRSPIPSEELQDVDQLSLGLEWRWIRPRKGLRSEQSLPFRFGFRLGKFPGTDPLLGGELREKLLSLGTGFKVQGGKGSLDLAVFLQGLDSGGLPAETRWGLALSLRTSEKWKRRTLPY